MLEPDADEAEALMKKLLLQSVNSLWLIYFSVCALCHVHQFLTPVITVIVFSFNINLFDVALLQGLQDGGADPNNKVPFTTVVPRPGTDIFVFYFSSVE